MKLRKINTTIYWTNDDGDKKILMIRGKIEFLRGNENFSNQEKNYEI